MAHGLVVYYSRTGHTRQLAEAIAAASGFDIEPVIDMRPRAGLVGYLRSAFEAATARLTPIGATRRDPRDYDVVVVGTPIWYASVSSPIRTWLEQHRAGLPAVASFVTCGGRGAARTLAQMRAVAGVDPLATLVLPERDLRVERIASGVQQFLAEIDAGLARPAAPPQQPGASA